MEEGTTAKVISIYKKDKVDVDDKTSNIEKKHLLNFVLVLDQIALSDAERFLWILWCLSVKNLED